MPRYRVERTIVIFREEVANDGQEARDNAKRRDLHLGSGWKLAEIQREEARELSPSENTGVPEALQEPNISAVCYPDDHAVEVTFSANPWFAQATNEEILALHQQGYGGDYTADSVAELAEEYDQNVAEMFAYKRIRGIGFDCHVNEQEARAWLVVHRPQLLEVIEQEDA